MSEAWLEELTSEECLALLRAEVVGRIAVVADGSPVVLPVSYRLVETTSSYWIALRTRPGNVIDRARREVAFEIDGVDRLRHRGWSVLVRGALHHVDSEASAAVRREFSLPWLLADRESWLLVEPHAVSGRRLQDATMEWAFHASAYL